MQPVIESAVQQLSQAEDAMEMIGELLFESADGDQIRRVTYKIVSKGRKWYEAVVPGKGYKAQIEINDASASFEVGQEVTFDAKIHMERNRYGVTVKVYPLDESAKADAQKEKNLSEIKRWLGYVEEKAPTGYLYQKGVDTLKTLGVSDFPEFQARLDTAISTAKAEGAKSDANKWLGYIKEHITRYWYYNGESKLWESISAMKRMGVDPAPFEKRLSDLKEEFQSRKDKEATGGYQGETYKLSGGSGYGYRGWSQGQVVRNSPRSIEKGEPEYMVVLSASKRYVPEDGMSFGVGDESGYIYSAVTRSATDDESAPLREKESKVKEAKEATGRIALLKKDIQDRGERPPGVNEPDGDEVLISGRDTRIYGGGEWFVVGKDYIWYVMNNGSDGSDWSANNVRTGGAGAIGWRIPFDSDIAASIYRDVAASAGKDDWHSGIYGAKSMEDLTDAFKKSFLPK